MKDLRSTVLPERTKFTRWSIKWGNHTETCKLYLTETGAKIARSLLERSHRRWYRGAKYGQKMTIPEVVKVTVIVEI